MVTLEVLSLAVSLGVLAMVTPDFTPESLKGTSSRGIFLPTAWVESLRTSVK